MPTALKMNIGIISPSKNAYSETFIQAHKERLKGKIFYYYGTPEECYLEAYGSLKRNRKKIFYKIKRKLYDRSYKWFHERFIIDSFKFNKIDVILAEFGDVAHKFINPLKELNLPLIVHFHGRDASVLNIIESCDNYREVFKTARYVVAVSHRMYNNLLILGCPREKLVYNVYGPNETFLDVLPKFSKPQFISIGRFVNKKAPYFVILAFIKALEKFPEAKLIMAGEGELRETCENLVLYYGIGDSVLFTGKITPERFKNYLEESLALVQHSINAKNGDAEGTPLAILEAGAAGLPVIATRHAGIQDVIINGENGYLIDEYDVDAMSCRMIDLLKSEKLAKEMGVKGRENIRTNFTLERHINKLNDLIKQAYQLKMT